MTGSGKRGSRARRSAFWAVAATGLIAGLAGCDAESPEGRSAVNSVAESGSIAEAETHGESYTVRSASGRAVVELERVDPTVRYASLHEWRLRVLDLQGRVLPPGPIAFDGGMPSHRHGFENRPLITGRDDDGWHRVEGVRFHMPGAWVLKVEFLGDAGMDRAELELDVPY